MKRLAAEKESAKIEAYRLLAEAREACGLPPNDASHELPDELKAVCQVDQRLCS